MMRAGLLLLALVIACRSDELKPGFCETALDCRANERCADRGPDFHRCVPINPADAGRDRPVGDAAPEVEDAAPDAPDAADALDDAGDAREVAPAPCAGPSDCLDPLRPLCVDGVCAGCNAPDAGACPAQRPLCASTGACLECARDDACATPERPICATATGTCAGCGASGGDNACRARDPARPVCASSGRCDECSSAAHCRLPGKAFCVMGACAGCVQAGAGACTGALPACDPTSGACVACVADADCKAPTAPFCVANQCVPCAMAPAGRCASARPTQPACSPSGACVECNASADCAFDPARPICDVAAQTCGPCTGDAACAGRGPDDPGICLPGGRCASPASVIHVANRMGCAPGQGTKAAPLCAPQAALALVSPMRSIVLINGSVTGLAWTLPTGTPAITVVGQQGVVVGELETGVRLDGPGEVLLRDLTIRGGERGGVHASGGATLRLERVVVESNPGGGIRLEGAHFDIRASVIRNNGPAQTGAAMWGGVLVLGVPGPPARIELSSIRGNRQVGLACDAAIMGTGVFLDANVGGDAQPICGPITCLAEGPGCGAPAP